MKYYSSELNLNIENPHLKGLITVVDDDSLSTAVNFLKPCCLNFASPSRPGGGYESVIDLRMPIKTQEEDLFRRSNLPELMDSEEVKKYYPLTGIESIYCSAVASKDKYLNNIEPFEFAVVTMPAVINPTIEDYKTTVKQKVKMIFDIAIENVHKNLILGAWGCGIFGNNPETIANLFLQEIELRKGYFENVIFAIPGEKSHNHQVFLEEIKNFI